MLSCTDQLALCNAASPKFVWTGDRSISPLLGGGVCALLSVVVVFAFLKHVAPVGFQRREVLGDGHLGILGGFC